MKVGADKHLVPFEFVLVQFRMLEIPLFIFQNLKTQICCTERTAYAKQVLAFWRRLCHGCNLDSAGIYTDTQSVMRRYKVKCKFLDAEFAGGGKYSFPKFLYLRKVKFCRDSQYYRKGMRSGEVGKQFSYDRHCRLVSEMLQRKVSEVKVSTFDEQA